MGSRKSSEALELYKTAVEMADRVSERRGRANQFYLSLQALFLSASAAVGFGGVEVSTLWPKNPAIAVVTGASGLVIAIAWYLQLRSYRDLNRAKFEVINSIETSYFKVRPFSSEWDSLKKDPIPKWRKRYAELGTIERVLPWVFAVAQVSLVVATFVVP